MASRAVLVALLLTTALPACLLLPNDPITIQAHGGQGGQGAQGAQEVEARSCSTDFHTRLNIQQVEVNSRFSRMKDRLHRVHTDIVDLKTYVREQLAALEQKLERALTDSTCIPGTQKPQKAVYRGCEDALARGATTSGIYNISLDGDKPIALYCEQRLDHGGWTVFQNRFNGSVDFYNGWDAYKAGFGDLNEEFWLGNDKIHHLTKHYDQQLKIELMNHEGEVQFADYSRFWVADEGLGYRLTVSGSSGGSPPGNAMGYHSGAKFSTKDRDNDQWSAGHCAINMAGGWWYKYQYSSFCHATNLNGRYGNTSSHSMDWASWGGHGKSLRATRMMMRTKA